MGSLVAGRYRVKRFIAAGGMGEVYEVHDTTVDATIALKTLRHELAGSSDAIARLRREIALARSVTNLHVCRLHDVGEHGDRIFLTMELLEGRTLAELLSSGPLPEAEVERIAAQLVDGLASLHRADIVHRDFKTSNVIVVGAGLSARAVITDFGLARSLAPGNAAITQSADATMLGTPAYMSPEQVEARPATRASDIYAFGVVLFELLTGKMPFREDTAMATATARLKRDAPAPSSINPAVSARWDAIVQRCLAREPSARFTRIEDTVAYRPPSRRWFVAAGGAAVAAAGLGVWRLAASRRARAAATFGAVDIVAVLPVGGSSGIYEDPWRLALTLDIHTALATSAVPHLYIHSGAMRRTLDGAAMQLAAQADPVAAALAIPYVTTVATMTLAADPDRLALDVRGHGGALAGWTQRFTRPRDSAASLVHDVASAMATRLGARAPHARSGATPATAELYERWGHALAALYRERSAEERAAMNRGEAPSPRKALADLVAAQPDFVQASELLADVLVMSAEQQEDVARSEATLDEVDRLVNAIQRIDRESAVSFACAGHAAMLRWDWRNADELTKRAYDLAPTHSRVAYHRNFLEMMLGRFDSAVAQAERDHARNPGQRHGTGLAWHYYYARRFPEVVRIVEPVVDRLDFGDTLDAITLATLVNAYAELARFDDAMALAERMRAAKVDNYALGNAVGAYVMAGRVDEAKALRAQIGDDVDLGQRWLIHDALGDIDAAIADLEKVLAARNIHALFIKIERISTRLRSDPRYQAMLARVGFPA